MKRKQIDNQNPEQRQLQKGQALIEAALTLIALTGLIFAIQLTGELRANSLELLGKSSYQTFLKTLKKSERKDSSSSMTTGNSELQMRFAEQLLYVSEDGFIHAQSTQDRAAYLRMPAYRALSPLSLSRTSYLFVNAGQSDSASEVQSRIENSNEPWLNATRPTRVLLKSVSQPLRRTDAPWRRPPLTTDWLKSWAGQSPLPSVQEQMR